MLAFPLLALAGLALSLAVGLRGTSSWLAPLAAAMVALAGCALQIAHLVWLRGRLAAALAEVPWQTTHAVATCSELGGAAVRTTAGGLAIAPSLGWYLALVSGALAALFAVLATVLTYSASSNGASANRS